MIIDAILDRRGGVPYNVDSFIQYCSEEIKMFEMNYKFPTAIIEGDNKFAREELCRYINEQDYNPDIKKYINAMDWCDKYNFLEESSKVTFILDYVVNTCQCIWELFQDNVGGSNKLASLLRKCNTKKDIKNMVHKYI